MTPEYVAAFVARRLRTATDIRSCPQHATLPFMVTEQMAAMPRNYAYHRG